jgi:mannopine transport system substrate-binding protein
MRIAQHVTRSIGLVLAVGLLVSACAPAALAASKAGPAGQGGRLEGELVVLTGGGAFETAFKRHFYDAFTAATGVTVIPVAAPFADQWAKIKADTETNNVQWDIVDTGPTVPPERQPYLRDLGDCTELPNVVANGVAGACAGFNVLRTIGGGVLAYNTEKFAGTPPESWKDFWDLERFPGSRALPARETFYTLMVALYADGVPPDQIFPMDVDRAFRKLDQIKPSVTVYWTSGDHSQQLWRSGEVVMSMLYSGRAVALRKEGVPVGYAWKGAPKDIGGWGILKDAPHPNAALAFLDFFYANPDAHLAFAEEINYDTGNAAALQLVPEGQRPDRATFPANWDNMILQDVNWVEQNQSRVLERWNAWLAS